MSRETMQQSKSNSRKYIKEEKVGFSKGHSCIDCVLTVTQLTETRKVLTFPRTSPSWII